MISTHHPQAKPLSSVLFIPQALLVMPNTLRWHVTHDLSELLVLDDGWRWTTPTSTLRGVGEAYIAIDIENNRVVVEARTKEPQSWHFPCSLVERQMAGVAR